MISDQIVSTAVILGFASSIHCIGMCGGISAAFGIASSSRAHKSPLTSTNEVKTVAPSFDHDPKYSGKDIIASTSDEYHNVIDLKKINDFLSLLSFNLGRITCYALAGLVLGFLTAEIADKIPDIATPLRIISALFIIAMGLYISQIWMGLSKLEQFGAHIWRRIQPQIHKIYPVETHPQAFGLGIFWGFMPCGLIYSTLLWAASATQGPETAIAMLFFGLGTLPALLINGMFFQYTRRYLQEKSIRYLLALSLIAFGLWSAFSSSALFPAGELAHCHH